MVLIADDRIIGTGCLIVLVILALPFLAVIGWVSSRHQDAVYCQAIPGSYAGQWAGVARAIQDPTGLDIR